MSHDHRYAYVHGFASGSASRKGTFLRGALEAHGVDLELPDLNRPSFERQTYTAILGALDAMDREVSGSGPWRLIGSSMGGYLALRWAELHPDRVDRLLLLCPGFDLPSRWPKLLGAGAMRRWERYGTYPVEDAEGVARPLCWRFVEDARTHPTHPEAPCPTRILHGIRDEIVPVASSRAYVRARPWVDLVELDDDHALGGSLDRLVGEARRFFDLDPSAAERPG
jgi:pimeloyl-ACP methyl ester carboxylesterase